MKGVLRWLTIEGLNLERFVRRAGENGIAFVQIKRRGRKLSVLVAEESFPQLFALAEQGGWAYTEGKRYGTGRMLDWLRQRWMLLAAVLISLSAVVWAAQMMWSINITGAETYQEDVKAYLASCHIQPPLWKNNIDLSALRDDLEWRYPRIAWVECGWRGTTLNIRLVQGVSQGETLSNSGAGDVVASRGGIIDSVITASGTPLVQAGQIIQPGQVLIAGYEQGRDGEQISVMARGTVLARVWDSAAVRVSCIETETHYTGRQQLTWGVYGPWLCLTQPKPSIYDEQDIERVSMPLGGLFFPFTVVMERRAEVESTGKLRNITEVQAEAAEAALRALRRKTDFADDFIDKWVDYCMIEGEVVEAVAYGERLIDIGTPRRSQ